MSAKMSSTKILQPSCSPKKLTLLPTTGPKSSRTGDSRAVRHERNFRRALVAKTASSTTADAASGCASGSVLRGARRSNSPTGSVGFGLRSSGFGVLVLQVRRVLEVLVLENQNQNPERRTPNPSGFYAPTRCGPAACGWACGCCCELCCG